MYPEHFRYTKEHEWVSVEGTRHYRDHRSRAAELGDIVYVDLPKVGDHCRRRVDTRLGGIRQSRIRHLFAGLR